MVLCMVDSNRIVTIYFTYNLINRVIRHTCTMQLISVYIKGGHQAGRSVVVVQER